MRVLIAIGCNNYDHAETLRGAEDDAQRVFDILLRPEVGQYDPSRSALLLSPSYEQVRQCLQSALFNGPKIDTFTFFFAGHGGVSAGSFYMWVRDSSPQAQSMSALSLADLFRSLNEASPVQSNLMIDACESGGLIADLGVLLKPNLLGDAGTPALTLVATSAQNQSSLETEAGGFGTNAILDCIEGRDFVQDSSSVLDLVEIGKRISTRLKDTGQNPVVWGLNLHGAPSFCRNPKYGSDPSAPLRDFIQNWPAESNQSIDQNYESLWAAYSSVSGSWDVDEFLQVVRSVLAPCTANPDILTGHVERLAATFLLKAALSADPFRTPQVAGCLAVCLLPYVQHPKVEASAARLLEQMVDELQKANALLIEDLSNNKYALLSNKGGGLPDLYQLPLRIAKVLGWAGAGILISKSPEHLTKANEQFSVILRLVLDHYSGSVVALSDAQAPFWNIALISAKKLNMQEEAEQLAGLIFNSFTACKGKIARWDIPQDRTLEYLLARSANDFSGCLDLVERPVETLTVLLKVSTTLDLEEVFDDSLWKLDGLAFSAYLPSDYFQFGAPMMEGGQSLVWSVGHDVFHAADLHSSWPVSSSPPETPIVASLAVIASLLLPDRAAWFLLEEKDSESPLVS